MVSPGSVSLAVSGRPHGPATRSTFVLAGILAVCLVVTAALTTSQSPASAQSGNCPPGHATRYVAQQFNVPERGIQHRINKGNVTWYHPSNQVQILQFFAGVQSNHPGWLGNIWQLQAGVVRGTVGTQSTGGTRVYFENWDINTTYNSAIYYSLTPGTSNFFNAYNDGTRSGPYTRWSSYYIGSSLTLLGQAWMWHNGSDSVQATSEVDAFEPGDNRCPRFNNPHPSFGTNGAGSHNNGTRLFTNDTGTSTWTLWTSLPQMVADAPYARSSFHNYGAFAATGGD